MLKKHEIAREFIETFNINGHDVEATVKIGAIYDECFELDWDFETKEEKQKLIEKINSGFLTPMGVCVEIQALGLIGHDSIWGCLISSEKDVLETADEHSLKDQALQSLKDEIKAKIEHAKKLEKFA